MNPLIVTVITTISILLLLWIATLVYHRIKPTEYVAYLANIAQVSLIAVTACSFIFVYFQTDQNFRKTTENSDRQFEQQAALTRAQFEQENRAFLEIIAPKIIFSKIVLQDNFPAIQFQVSADLKNHGKSPAYLIRTDFILESLDKKTAKPFMPTPEDQEKYIKNLDVFPQETQNISWSPFLNLNDIGQLVSIESDTIKSIADLIKRTKEGLVSQDSSKINFHTKDCYLIIQTEYSNLGDSNRKYFYSARFRTDLSEGFKNRLVETKIGKSAEEGKWYYVSSRSELSQVVNGTDESVMKQNGRIKSHSPEKDSKTMNWKIVGAIGAILGGIGSFTAVFYLLFKETILARIRRPIIYFEYDFKAPYVTRSNSDNAYFFHLGLMNNGKSVAKRCMVYLDEIHTKGANGWSRQATFIPMVLHWVRESFSPTDIQRGQTKLIDIGNIPIDAAHQTHPYPFRLWFEGFSDITGVPHGEHIFKYSVYGDNLQNKVVWIKLNWKGQSADAVDGLKSHITLELLMDKPRELI